MASKVSEAQCDLRFDAVGDTGMLGHAEAIYRVYRNHSKCACPCARQYTDRGECRTRTKNSVRDHGSVIADQDLPYIFERFWRKTDGAGLGIVQRLA